MVNNNIYDFAYSWANDYNTEQVELKRLSYTYTRATGSQAIPVSMGNITVSIQPMNEADLINLPEGDREKDIHKIYCTTTLLVNDIVVWDEIEYQIKTPPQKWKVSNTLQHYKAFIYRVETEEQT